MRNFQLWLTAVFLIGAESCLLVINDGGKKGIPATLDSVAVKDTGVHHADTFRSAPTGTNDTAILPPPSVNRAMLPGGVIDTKHVNPNEVVAFAETLVGVPYKYASIDPNVGFDCSGFITYVFNHFGIKVPRSSIDFTNVEKPIPVAAAKRGDIILFTGTDSTERFVGHMGIVVSNTGGQVAFIHSSSGKARGVTVTPLNSYYMGRFMKMIRIFPQNDESKQVGLKSRNSKR